MALISASRIAKHYGGQTVFQDVSCQIDDGKRIVLVGVNGAGKTTLLRILAGLEEPDAGSLSRQRNLRIGYLPQDAFLNSSKTLYEEMLAAVAHILALQDELQRAASHLATADENMQQALEEYAAVSHRFEQAGGYIYETRIAQVLSGLGFSEEDRDKPIAIMSGGQRTRAALAQVLISNPDLLLLDEPTNHLDLAATEWLEDYLLHWPGAMVIVSHDRRFLDSVAQEVWDLAFGRLESYTGNYTTYTHLRAERMARWQAEYEAQQEKIAATEEFIRRYSAGQRSKEARGRAKQLARLKRLEKPQEAESLHLRLSTAYRGGDRVLEATGLVIGYGSPLVTCPPLLIRRGERVALIGPNGSGKTTLLKTILGEVSPLAGEVRLGGNVHPAYYSQTHEGLRLEASVLDHILDYEPIVEKARGFLGRFLFSGDDVFKRVEQLSGGERSRLALARLTLENANFLLLDEPTNHLDILSQEVLEDVLSGFNGTILFVSHDRYLIDALATHIWVIENGRLLVYEGTYSDYQEEKARREQGTISRRPLEKQKREQSARAMCSLRLERERQALLVTLEEQITNLEKKLAQLNEEMMVAGQRGETQRVWQLSLDYQATEEELARVFAAWEHAAT